MKKTMIAVAATLTLCLATFAGTAHACGPYGPPTPEQEARSELTRAIYQQQVHRYISAYGVDLFDAKSGEGTLHYTNGRTLRVGLAYFKGRWRVVAHRPRRPATRVAALR